MMSIMRKQIQYLLISDQNFLTVQCCTGSCIKSNPLAVYQLISFFSVSFYRLILTFQLCFKICVDQDSLKCLNKYTTMNLQFSSWFKHNATVLV